jgi:hypothetical protein
VGNNFYKGDRKAYKRYRNQLDVLDAIVGSAIACKILANTNNTFPSYLHFCAIKNKKI